MRASSLIAGLLLAGALGLSGQARADALDRAAESLADGLSRALLSDKLGQARPVAIFLRPPFDDSIGTPCRPMSRKIRQRLAAALRDRFRVYSLDEARVVQAQKTGPGHLIISTSWRDAGPDALEIAIEVGDLGSDPPAWYHSGDASVPRAAFTAGELACLFRPAYIDETRTARADRTVYRDFRNLRDVLRDIPAGTRYRLVARVPGQDRPWAIIRLLDTETADPFAERMGYAVIPYGEGELREALADQPRPGPGAGAPSFATTLGTAPRGAAHTGSARAETPPAPTDRAGSVGSRPAPMTYSDAAYPNIEKDGVYLEIRVAKKDDNSWFTIQGLLRNDREHEIGYRLNAVSFQATDGVVCNTFDGYTKTIGIPSAKTEPEPKYLILRSQEETVFTAKYVRCSNRVGEETGHVSVTLGLRALDEESALVLNVFGIGEER